VDVYLSFLRKEKQCWVWWPMPEIPTLGRLRIMSSRPPGLPDEFQAHLGYRVRLYQKYSPSSCHPHQKENKNKNARVTSESNQSMKLFQLHYHVPFPDNLPPLPHQPWVRSVECDTEQNPGKEKDEVAYSRGEYL
jgi:hypothetical protein